jgi:hypothetical protein
MKASLLKSLNWVTVTVGFVSLAGNNIHAEVSRPNVLAGTVRMDNPVSARSQLSPSFSGDHA